MEINTNLSWPNLKPPIPYGSPIVVFYNNRFSDADCQKLISDSYSSPKKHVFQ